MPSLFQRHLESRPLLLDGAMGSTIQTIELDIETDYLGHENCVDLLVRSRPELVQQIHEGFLAAGSDAVETNTFGANKLVFSEFGDELVPLTRELNREAALVARAACDAYATAERPRFVLGSMGPGTKLITLGQTTWDLMLDSYAEQARGLIDGGVDAFLIETCQDLLQVKCAINACLTALAEAGKSTDDIPIMVSVTIESTGTMLLGADIAAAVTALRPYPILSLGLNCATGPVEMAEHLGHLSHHWDRHVTVFPNAGLPVLHEGKPSFPLGPEAMSETLDRFVRELGISLIGGCCGTTTEHITALRGVLDSLAADSSGCAERSIEYVPGSTSGYSHVDYRQENSFLIVGERLNASGSKRFRQLLEKEDWDAIVSLARDQCRRAANVLDVNVDYAGRDNPADMAEIVSRIATSVDAPLMLDSTQPDTLEAGLRRAPGKCIINSANFEDGDEKFDQICALAARYGAALVIGSIDEDEESAMARTCERKVAIARRGLERAVEVHGLAPADVMFDPLVLPISTGMDSDRRSGLELVDAVREIARTMPECQITCGLSNCSFGLKAVARKVLNSVMLHELMEAGLTSAIVHAGGIAPLARIPEEQIEAARDLIYDRRREDFDPLAAFIDLFKDASQEVAVEEEVDRTLPEWLRWHIINGEREQLEDRLDQAMLEMPPLEIINEHLLEGMKTVGELFGSGQMQLPFVLQSAQVMKRAVGHLEPHMDRVEGETRGSIVLATVKGDVHDIGKNLVDIILTNNGWTVHNIGIKQPISEIIKAWKETGADLIGMSGLLVKSVMVMGDNLEEMNQLEEKPPVILGGAALSRFYCESHLRSIYQGKLFYGKDAFEGLRVCDLFTQGGVSELDSEIDARLEKRASVEKRVSDSRARTRSGEVMAVEPPVVAPLDQTLAVPAAPFLGSRLVESVPLREILPYINETALFRGQWGFRRGSTSKPDYEAMLDEKARPVFDRLATTLAESELIQPSVVYGWYECQSQGDDLVIWNPDDPERELERFSFPRQTKRARRCISDFFRSVDSGERDVIGFHCVTMGPRMSEEARRLFEADEYQEYLFVHGFGVECAEGLAELWHKRMRAELGIGGNDSPRIRDLFTQKYRGSRYSFGYPACPEMSDQEKLFRLLDPARIGCRLTENWQIDPEQSTSALIVHHPEAKYFTI
ncbi:MAG: methionine synthase [Planctomycetes bacterium TMED75]|nr:methionine synthase [Planctomycetaceae bacterium]OUU91270.1 MAG: methionine synthase [Planctomycetes bacterium TMED75]